MGQVMIDDHIGYKSNKAAGDRRKIVRKISSLDIRRADTFEAAEINQCWSLFKCHLLSTQEQAIPKCQAGKAEG